MRKIWPKGTVLCTRDGAEYTIDSANDTGGSAVIYFASSSRSGVRAVLKEFYPSEGWVRKGGIPVPEKCADATWDDSLLQSGVQQLSDFAKQEMGVSQEIARRTTLVWPFREMLQVTKICEPGNGPVWMPADKVGDILPCCILLMDDLNHPDGLWLKDLLREAAFEKSAVHPLGNLQGQDEPELAVPPVAAAVDAARCILSLLYRIHHGGYLHGDINLGNVFLLTDHIGGKITNAMTIDFGSARGLVDGKTAPVQKNTLFTTPGFCAPEIEKGKLSDKLLQLTEKADVYSVGKLLRMLLYPEAAAAFREHRSLELWLRDVALSEWDVYDSAVSPDVLRRLNEILTGAAEEEVDARSSVEEMLEQLDQVHLLLEPPPWQVKLALPELNGSEVIGREADICSIETELQVHKKLVLHGFSGIGKTKLATLLGHEWQKTYPDTQVYYAFFPGSMTSLVLNTLAQNISTVDTMMETKDKKQVPRPGEAITADVFAELNAHMHPDDLLIIDNIDSDTKSWEELVHEKSPWGKDLFEELCSLQCRVIFVTRMDLKNAEGIAPYPVGKLDGKNLRTLLRRYSDDAKARSDQELDDLIRLVDYHTMTVAMVSKTMQESELTVPEIYKELEHGEYGSDAFVRIKGEKPGDYEQRKIEEHLICLFRLSNFNEREQALLRYAQLIGEDCGMYEKLFLICCPHKNREEDKANLEALNHLVQMGYIQRKKEDNKESLLNLHTLVRVVAKKVLPIRENQADAFLEGMPLPYRKYEMENLWMASIAESYVQAREVVGKETFLFGYWSSCASAWLYDVRKTPDNDEQKVVCRFVECLSDAVRIYNALEKTKLSLEGVQNAQEKVFCLHRNIWSGLSNATPGMVRKKCGTSESAQRYWTFCLGEPERNLTYPALFQDYQKYVDLGEEVHQKLLTEFHPKNDSDYWFYTHLVDKKEQIRAGKEILKNFERKTPEDYKRYLEICSWLRMNAEELNAANGVKDSQRKENVLFEQQEKRAVREYLEFLEEQRPTEYKEIIQAYQEYIRCCERNLNREAVELYCKKLLEKRKSYLDFLMHQVPLDVMEQVMCCNDIIKQYQNRFKDEEKSEQYREISLRIRKDFVENPKRYLLIKEPSNEMQVYVSTLNDISRIPGEERTMLTFCQRILKFGQANEKKVTEAPTREEIKNGRYFDIHSKEKICELLRQAILSLEKEKFSEQDDKTVRELLREMRVLLQRLEEKAVSVPRREKSSIASETEVLVHDLQNEEMTDEKDRNYRQAIFSKAESELWGYECEKDLERIINAYEEAGEYSKQQKWLEQIICLQDAGILGDCRDYFGETIFRCRMPNGKIDATKFYIGHFFMEPYYERAIYAAQKSGDDDKAFEFADKMFDVFSKDREAIVGNKSCIHQISDLLAWLRGCSLYAYSCCTRGQYHSALVGLKKAQKDLRRFARCAPFLCHKEEVIMAFYKDQLEALKEILPKHHPIFVVQYKLMYPCCMGIKETIKVAKMIIKESILCRFYNWNSSN